MRILITGASGFVGRHFDHTLSQLGHDIVRVDVRDPLAPVDARDFFRRNDERFDLVIHLAAVVGGRATIEGAPLKVAVDLAIDAEMFGWALRTRPARIVYYSSSAAYPIGLQVPGSTTALTEEHIDLDRIATPDLTYGWAKLTGEMLARHAEAEGLRVHVFRPFSGYGEDQDLDYPFPSFIARAARKDDPFEIWGDGTQVRDWIHIDDITDATLDAVDQDVPGPINLGWGRATSFNELAALVTQTAGYQPEFKHLTAQPSGVHYRVADNTRMLGYYQPRISLEEGIQRALRAAA